MPATLAPSSIKSIYRTSLTLLTDFYELSMAYGYWCQGLQDREASFHLFFRKSPFGGGFTICAGLQNIVDLLQDFRFTPDDIAYLRSLKNDDGSAYFDPAFVDYLAEFELECDIDAMPEGSVVFPQEPILRVTGPLLQAQFLETVLLNLINFPTLIATKAARVCMAAEGDPVFEFGLRRAQGIDGGLTASRAAYIGGCHSTSNVLAGKLYDIPVKGTMAHSWVLVYENELEAFRRFAESMPKQCIFLVDTFNSHQGIDNAIEVGRQVEANGHKFQGVRLDSGDLTYLSIMAREKLDAAGFKDTQIYASNELDETLIGDLKRQGAQMKVWGVGTHLSTGGSQASLGGVYKLSAIKNERGEWTHKLKLSEQIAKISNPGILQVRRFRNENNYLADAIYDVELGFGSPCRIFDPLDPTRQRVLGPQLESRDLLVPIFRKGKCVYDSPDLKSIREYSKKELSQFHSSIKRFINPHQHAVGLEENLYQIKHDLITKLRQVEL